MAMYGGPPGQGGMMPPGHGGMQPGMPHPGAMQQTPQQWQRDHGGPPPNQNDGDSEGDSGDEMPKANPVKFDVQFAGYGNTAPVGQMAMLPPPPPPPPPSGPPPDMRFTEISNMDEAACRDAMLHFVSEHCCYGSAPAKEMSFKSLKPMTALHYTLETFGEARCTGYKTVPYRGEYVDGPENGMPPPPWGIPCEPSGLFNNQVKLIEVPHTSFVRPCQNCHAKGWLTCHRCHGRGHIRCNSCGGDGRVQRHDAEGNVYSADCGMCVNGKRTCHHCGGDGRVTCGVCQGFTQLRCYVELKVEYVNHADDYILEQTDMPDELVRHVGGKPVFEQTLQQVWPIVAYPIREVNENSQNLVNLHRSRYTAERVIMQRQILRAVPVTEVEWEWKEERGKRLWVYGNEHKVYCPDYPQQCCWGCNVL